MKSARKIRALRKGILLSCLFAVVLMIAVYESFLFGRALFSESAYGSSAVTVEVTVTEGESTLQVARMLEDNGLISNQLLFVMKAGLYGYKLQAGVYTLSGGKTQRELLQTLSLMSAEKKN